jgi:hypothetical protein
MIYSNTNPHSHTVLGTKTYELREGVNGQGKAVYLVNTLINGSIHWTVHINGWIKRLVAIEL